MSLDKVLRLGNPKLYMISEEVQEFELNSLRKDIDIMHKALMEFREIYHAGRAIAAPQIGVLKRFIYLNIDEPLIIINPEILEYGDEKFQVWDDCLCFPGLEVKVERSQQIKMKYKNKDWETIDWELKGNLAELIQHEYDHLDGILAIQRAINKKSFRMIK